MSICKFLVSLSLIAYIFAAVPLSPFGKQKDICPQGNGYPYSVGGYPGTPYIVQPFTDIFRNPVEAQNTGTVCRSDGHCMRGFEIDVKETQLRPFDKAIASCKQFPGTWFLSYNGSIPGPTIRMPAGHESLVRFNNKINYKTGFFRETFSPCSTTPGRAGRPFAVHLHGSPSLAPYDGWAEDETCFAETKDYVYPNDHAAPEWYHDHALKVTADNAYLGLAGFYVTTDKVKYGGCGEPWNLENIEEQNLILADKVLDNKCQLYQDYQGPHKNNLYGDINLVSGIPFPKIMLEPKWYRLRMLNAATSRPYLVQLKDENLVDIGPSICKIIAADGGYRESPVAFPVEGLLFGVAERWEIVCDFTNFKGKSLYLWNGYDDKRMKAVPYFCYSHLIANLQIGTVTPVNAPVFQEFSTAIPPDSPLFTVLTQADVDTATAMAYNDEYNRQMKFGRSGGQWVINGETWDTMKIAAKDVGQNTWELWRLETGGGWFHPIHIHLVDMFIIRRVGANGVLPYERMSPKDVIYLGPGETIYVLVRFGPHKGDYMFHCHNLVHEDNLMMRAFSIINSTLGLTSATAAPFIINPLNNIIYSNYKYANPLLPETNAKPTVLMPTFDDTYLNQTLTKDLYRIFYPLPADIILMNGVNNPWQDKWCPIKP